MVCLQGQNYLNDIGEREMEKEQKVTSSAYRKIAIDIANDIVSGKYSEGQKLFGRSVLASYYKVSPETIRRSVFLLKDVGILDTEKGSGIEVKSFDKAKEFIDRQAELQSVSDAKNEVIRWAKKQAEETAEAISKIQFIIDAASRVKSLDPVLPFELRITSDSVALGKTIDELRFWHNTGGTVVAIRRGETLIVSPGPYAMFSAGDIFYIVGNENAHMASINLLFEKNAHQEGF